jgi:opacity protein-like surface antigen
MNRLIPFTALLLALIISVPDAHAQVSIELGPRAGYDIGGDIDELFLGADARFGLADIPVDVGVTFDYYLMEENISLFQLSVNAYYDFALADAGFVPYAGAGIGISRMSFDYGDEFGEWFGSSSASSSDTGINLLGGIRFPMGGFTPYAQAQFTIGDLDLLTLSGGLLIPLGGR